MVALCAISYGVGKIFNLNNLITWLTKKIVVIIITVNTLIVFFIVFFVLTPVQTGEWEPLSSLSELLTHNLSTVLMIMVFVLIPGSGVLKNRDALTVLIYPFVYFILHTIIGLNFEFKPGGDEFGPAFNYGFINPNNYDSIFVFIGLIVMLVGIFGALGFGLIQFKNRFDVIKKISR
jgi:hypothetical protein